MTPKTVKESKLLKHALECKKRIENWPQWKQKIAEKIGKMYDRTNPN